MTQIDKAGTFKLGDRSVKRKQVAEGRAITDIAHVPFFPLGGSTPLQSTGLSDAADALDATPMPDDRRLLRVAETLLAHPGTPAPARTGPPRWGCPRAA